MRLALSWAFYWLGDLVWRSGVDRWEWGHGLYSWLMKRSSDLQIGNERGPWRGA